MTEAEIFEFFHNLGIVPVVKIDDASKFINSVKEGKTTLADSITKEE